MTTAERDAEARALRAKGLLYREVGERMGESKTQAWRRVNREREREQGARSEYRHREQRRAYDRKRDEIARYVCPRCGHRYGKGSGGITTGKAAAINGTQCKGCIALRREQIVAYWADGLLVREIDERLGWTVGRTGVEMVKMRRMGYDLPYRKRPY